MGLLALGTAFDWETTQKVSSSSIHHRWFQSWRTDRNLQLYLSIQIMFVNKASNNSFNSGKDVLKILQMIDGYGVMRLNIFSLALIINLDWLPYHYLNLMSSTHFVQVNPKGYTSLPLSSFTITTPPPPTKKINTHFIDVHWIYVAPSISHLHFIKSMVDICLNPLPVHPTVPIY